MQGFIDPQISRGRVEKFNHVFVKDISENDETIFLELGHVITDDSI